MSRPPKPVRRFSVPLKSAVSSEATYKVGLSAAVNQQVFIDVLDLETDCHFLARAPH